VTQGRRTRPRVPPHPKPTPMREPTLDPRRAQIVSVLEGAPDGLDASELGRRVGLHPNTVRWHLDVLARAGLVTSAAEGRGTPGRPRRLYRLVPAQDDYRSLASVLVATLAADDAGADACARAGGDWGVALAEGRAGGADAVEAVADILTERGFEAEAAAGAITMRRCPFLELAKTSPAVVCAVHRGLIDGALRTLGSPLTVAALEIFPRPDACVAHLEG
jgi:predicted ArsR family transcriptional regulator